MCQSLAADQECLGKYKKMEQEALKAKKRNWLEVC
jgi:hypothetical protein